jgi:hypothetical protein
MIPDLHAEEPDWERITQCIADSITEPSDQEIRLLEKIFSTPAIESSQASHPHRAPTYPPMPAPPSRHLPRRQDGAGSEAARGSLLEWGRKQVARFVQTFYSLSPNSNSGRSSRVPRPKNCKNSKVVP